MGLPYDVRYVDIAKGDQFAPDFLKIAPNNRMPTIIDPDGPDAAPISVFESGAILQYLARKTGMFYGGTERERVAVEEWLFWQVGGLGPMAGQAHHFLKYAPQLNPAEDLAYPKDRYRTEVARLYGVMDRRLADRRFLAGDDFTIADMASYGWASLWEGQEQVLDDKPHFARWLSEVGARPAVSRGMAVGAERRQGNVANDKEAAKVLFRR